MVKINKPHKAILFIILLFGFILTIVTPPFQVPDEINHFYRAWQVSEGNFSSVKQNQRLGGYVPKSFDNFSEDFRPYTLNPYNQMLVKKVWQTRLIPLNKDDIVFKDFTNTALYSAFIYLPQALGIFIGKQFDANPFWLIYLGRLSNLLVFAFLIYFAIKLVPFKKWLFVVLVSLPMSLAIHSSLSADMLLNALSFLIIAIVLNLSFNKNIQRITYKHILGILFISVLIGLAKLIYVPILFIIVLIPRRKFISPLVRLGFLVVVISTGIGTAYIQKTVIESKHIPYSEYNEVFRDNSMLKKGVDINKQIEYISKNKIRTIKVFVKSFFKEFKPMSKGYIGILGWADIDLPPWFIYLTYFIILFLAMINFENDNTYNFSFFHRSIFGLIVFVLLVLIMLSQYLSWDQVGGDRVYPLQGRYFIPVFPLFFIMIFNILKIKISPSIKGSITKAILIFCIFSGILSVYIIISKSYTVRDYKLPKWETSYSFKNNIIDTSKNRIKYITLENDTIASIKKPPKYFISDKKTYTGSNSLKLSNKNPYGFTIKAYKGSANEKIIVSCRSYGDTPFLVVQEFPDGFYYQSAKTYPQKGSLGWKYNEMQFILPHNIRENNELRAYVWYPGKDSIYIDDFKITYFGND